LIKNVIMESPYKKKKVNQWLKITQKLTDQHPLKMDEIVEVVLSSWDQLFRSKIGIKPFFIGKDIFPKPQIMGFLLHELIPLELTRRYPDKWQKEVLASDKDIIYLSDKKYSIEIKTSSNPRNIYGNRSYAQKGKSNKKLKDGYYLAINFQKFGKDLDSRPEIVKIRFGWLDHTDWLGQKAATGQQARLSPAVEQFKLLDLYSLK